MFWPITILSITVGAVGGILSCILFPESEEEKKRRLMKKERRKYGDGPHFKSDGSPYRCYPVY